MNAVRTKAMLLPIALLITLFDDVYANNKAPLINVQPQNIYHTVSNKTLLEVTNQIANRAGFTFKINPDLKKDVITQNLAADDWGVALGSVVARL